MQDNLINHINMLNEEIMVLLLERKILSTIINCHVKHNIPYNGHNYNMDIKIWVNIRDFKNKLRVF